MVKPTVSPFWQAASPSPRAMCVLAGSAVAYGYDVLATLDVLAARELRHEMPVHRRYGREVEGVQALYGGEARGLDPASHQAVMSVYELQLRQPEQVVRMVHSL